MLVKKIGIKNFRLLKNTSLDLKEEVSLLVGKNNCGKTSFLVLFDKFYKNETFSFNDFSLSIRNSIRDINSTTDLTVLSIQMTLEIEYGPKDNLEHLSELILDLDPNTKTVKILFECAINKKKVLSDLESVDPKDRGRFIEKNLNKYLQNDLYIFEQYSDLSSPNRDRLIKKKIDDVKKVINFQVLHAKRDVASSEGSHASKKVLSILTTKFFNSKNGSDLKKINDLILEMDKNLDESYDDFFKSFLKNAKDFLNVDNLKVSSNLESQSLIGHSSRVIYGADGNFLPENLNGLGYMNILYLLLSIEILKDEFISEKKEINLLFIEEPEAHTHPQMQYVFSQKIKGILKDVKNIQTVITTHSSHIVSQCSFEDIRYMSKSHDKSSGDNVEIKNFDSELSAKYEKPEEFKFLKQYLTIQSAELFFADRVIFIEGVSERILLPYFIKQLNDADKKEGKLETQNISILEVGANSRVFHTFLSFLGVKTLILTDLDTVNTTRAACKVLGAESTSNYSLKHYLKAPEKDELKKVWFHKLVQGKLDSDESNIKIYYQTEEKGYHARSFEDAFINSNLTLIKENKDSLWGVKSLGRLDETIDIYDLTEAILDKKSDFASSILFLALSKDIKWITPSYIQEGISWLAN